VPFQFKFTLRNDWPPLGWIAECVPTDPIIRVMHGSQIELREHWFCEAIWDREFAAGDLDQTDLVFGSGARLRHEHIVFVSSGATVDRLQSLRLDGRILISNSLACLLGVSGLEVDIAHRQFPEFFRSIVRGIDGYQRRLPTQSGRLELFYFRNLTWDGHHLAEMDKPNPARDFSSFEKYYDFLKWSVKKIAANMRAPERRHPYEMVGALSSGYDSPTAVWLAREAGMKHVFSFRSARGGAPDDGGQLARRWGLDLALIDRHEWRRHAYAEVPYFAATCVGVDVNLSSAQEIVRGRVMVSGFYGDTIWAKKAKPLEPNFGRTDASGLAFTEHRLQLGSIHLPVPYMGGRQIREIWTLSSSAAMLPWDVPGEYSKPVCRRIVEEAGVPRDLFGVEKKATAHLFHRGESVLTNTSRADYYRWLRVNRQESRTIPKPPGRLLLAFGEQYRLLSRLLRAASRYFPARLESRLAVWDDEIQTSLNKRINVLPYLFPWAVERMAGFYHSGQDADAWNSDRASEATASTIDG
jgi:hypothetical protein